MTICNPHNSLIKLLTADSLKLKVVRHLILLAFSFLISVGLIWEMKEKEMLSSGFEWFGGLLFLLILFLGDSYLNIYLLTPKLLLRGKWTIYFCSLLGVVAPTMAVLVVIQTIYIDKMNNHLGDANLFMLTINSLASCLSLFLFFAGTTSIVLFKSWLQDTQRAEELESATLQLELKLLENQINPHFLFNMLNNANIMIKKDSHIASHIIGKLEEILRYQINHNSREKVSLKEETAFLHDYLELEKTRRDYFSYTITEEGDMTGIVVPPLLFITFVENSVKHNQDSRNVSYVHLFFKIAGDKLIFTCANSLSPGNNHKQHTGGIGLVNIERRLNLLYQGNYSLEHIKTHTNYTVKLELKL